MSRPRKYRKFTKEFKQEAVRLSLESSKTVEQVAEDLGITAKILSRWRADQARQGTDAFRGQGRRAAVAFSLSPPRLQP